MSTGNAGGPLQADNRAPNPQIGQGSSGGYLNTGMVQQGAYAPRDQLMQAIQQDQSRPSVLAGSRSENWQVPGGGGPSIPPMDPVQLQALKDRRAQMGWVGGGNDMELANRNVAAASQGGWPAGRPRF